MRVWGREYAAGSHTCDRNDGRGGLQYDGAKHLRRNDRGSLRHASADYAASRIVARCGTSLELQPVHPGRVRYCGGCCMRGRRVALQLQCVIVLVTADKIKSW